ncbi:MAG: hypothetical protein ABW196_08125 [Solirubrobacterales bacterium]
MTARRSALLFVVLAVALLPTGSAVGASTSTKIIVSLKLPAFHGKLKSSDSACSSGRTVKLFRQKAGPDKLLGTDRSNAKAKWSIPIGKRLKSGASYYAKAPAKGSCKAAKSKVLAIG